MTFAPLLSTWLGCHTFVAGSAAGSRRRGGKAAGAGKPSGLR